MTSRNMHKMLGLLLILPMFGWAATGLVFFLKPGYDAAYAMLPLKTYPLQETAPVLVDTSWQEVKIIRTILGYHLLVKSDGQTRHLDIRSLQEKAHPTEAETEQLINDAIAANVKRYGTVQRVTDNKAKTTTGIDITLDWNHMTLSQRGGDTELINALYKIHYLQWTPWSTVNQVLGVVGLLLLFSLTVMGIRIYVNGRIKR